MKMETKRKVEVAKLIKRWWTASIDGKVNLIVRDKVIISCLY